MDFELKKMSRSFYIEDNEPIPAIKYAESQPVGFSLITNESDLRALYIKQYKTRESDGTNYFNDFRVGLMLDIIEGLAKGLGVSVCDLLSANPGGMSGDTARLVELYTPLPEESRNQVMRVVEAESRFQEIASTKI